MALSESPFGPVWYHIGLSGSQLSSFSCFLLTNKAQICVLRKKKGGKKNLQTLPSSWEAKPLTTVFPEKFCAVNRQEYSQQTMHVFNKGTLQVPLISCFVLQFQLYLHEFGSVFVDEGAESQSVPEGRGHVGDGDIPVALTLDAAPLLQSLYGRHPGARSRTDPCESAAVPLERSRSSHPHLSAQRVNFRNFPQQLGHTGSGKRKRQHLSVCGNHQTDCGNKWKEPGCDTCERSAVTRQPGGWSLAAVESVF